MFGLSFNCREVCPLLQCPLYEPSRGVWWALIGYPSMDVCEIQAVPFSWKFSRDLYFKNFVVQIKFVKCKTLNYFQNIAQTLDIAQIRENYFLEIVDESKFVKYRDLENNQLYGIRSLRECLDY